MRVSVSFSGADGAARLPKARAQMWKMCFKSMLDLNVLMRLSGILDQQRGRQSMDTVDVGCVCIRSVLSDALDCL
jgi:hypothetical protein